MFTIEFLQALFPTYTGKKHERNEMITSVLTDSRNEMENALFVPIIGDNFNGHSFIQEAIRNGAIATLWAQDEPIPDELKETCTFFYVSDTISGLQQLAKAYRDDVDPTVVAITGSNGKTTTKDLVTSVLKTTWKTHATSGNFNNHIGLPLTILQMERDTEVLVVEMGMNRLKEISVLTNIAQPDYAIITNIGESHIEFLGSRENIAKAKLEITEGLADDGLLIIDGDEPLLAHLHGETYVRTCGFSQEADVVIKNVQFDESITNFEVNNTSYTVPIIGKHHAKNATLAIQVAKQLHVKEEKIKEGFISLEHSGMRFEWVKGKNGVTMINDAYNASPTSMKAAIQVVKQLSGYETKGIILGDILELGTYADSLHLDVAKEIDPSIDFVYTYGVHSKQISSFILSNFPQIEAKHFDSKNELCNHLYEKLDKQTLLLFKGSRGMKLEEVINKLL